MESIPSPFVGSQYTSICLKSTLGPVCIPHILTPQCRILYPQCPSSTRVDLILSPHLGRNFIFYHRKHFITSKCCWQLNWISLSTGFCVQRYAVNKHLSQLKTVRIVERTRRRPSPHHPVAWTYFRQLIHNSLVSFTPSSQACRPRTCLTVDAPPHAATCLQSCAGK